VEAVEIAAAVLLARSAKSELGMQAQRGTCVVIDTSSPPGSWQREIDFKMTRPDQLRAEIYDQRRRIAEYVREIEQLRARVRELEAREAAWCKEP
jgi:hypothetical protein